MTPWDDFKMKAVGRRLRLEKQEYAWVFDFSQGLRINVEANWRIRNSSRILLTNEDDQQQFGLPAPVVAQGVANDLLAGATVQSLTDDPATADLRIELTGDLLAEVLTNSSGYESWQAYTEERLACVGRND